MKLIVEYLAQSEHFQRMADEATDHGLKAKLHDQAQAYYRLAVRHAERIGAKPPEQPPFLH